MGNYLICTKHNAVPPFLCGIDELKRYLNGGKKQNIALYEIVSLSVKPLFIRYIDDTRGYVSDRYDRVEFNF